MRSIAAYTSLAVACLLLAAGAFLVVAAPVDALRDRLVEHIRARTGHEVSIDGTTAISLFPGVVVSLTDVSVRPAHGAPGDAALTVPRLEAEVGYWSLITGRPTVKRVTLHSPIIALSIDADGRPSWEMGGDQSRRRTPTAGSDRNAGGDGPASDRAPAEPTQLGFGEIAISDGTLRYDDARTGARYELAGLSLLLATDDAADTLRIEGTAEWKGERVSLTGKASPSRALVAGRAATLALRLSHPQFEVSYEGSLIAARAVALDGGVGFKSPSLSALLARLGKGTAAGEDADGLTASAQVTVNEARVVLSNLHATIGRTSVKGSLEAGIMAGRPHVRGKLAASDLDLGALLVKPAKQKGVAADAQAPAPPARGRRQVQGWRDDPIDLAALRSANVDIALSVERLAYKDIKAGPGSLSLQMNEGLATVRLDAIELYGGRAGGTLTVDATGEVPTAGAKLNLRGVSMPPLSADTLGFEWLDGRGNIALDVAGQGLTERQIVEALNGKLEVAVVDGAMIGADVGKIVGNLQQGRLANLAPSPGDRTPFRELAASFDIVNGTATSHDLRLVSTHVNLDGEGTFDLGKRQMHCELRAKISGGKRGEGTGLNVGTLEVPVTISGPWEKPAYSIKGQEQLIESVRQIGKRLKNRDVQDTIKGLLGSDKEERAKSREKARDLLENFLKKE